MHINHDIVIRHQSSVRCRGWLLWGTWNLTSFTPHPEHHCRILRIFISYEITECGYQKTVKCDDANNDCVWITIGGYI
jgi:hypothetical protein